MLIGFLLEGRARFDLLRLPWKVAELRLAVVFPVAALGLWLTVSWGPVIWVLAAGAQVLMYTVWPDIFGATYPGRHPACGSGRDLSSRSGWLSMKRRKCREGVRVDLL